MAIEIASDETRPTAICPHCDRKQMIDITPFQKDITKPIEANCVHCGGRIFAALLILLQTDLQRLYIQIGQVVELLNPKNKNLVG